MLLITAIIFLGLILMACAFLMTRKPSKRKANVPQLKVTISSEDDEIPDKPKIKRANQTAGFVYDPEFGKGKVPGKQRPLSFTAIDFETATNSRMACQLGIAVVENGTITKEKEFLIRPPENRYDRTCVRVHHILPSMTENAPSFKVLWPEISTYLQGRVVAAHNLSFDLDVLDKNMGYYDIEPINIPAAFCTCMDLDKADLFSACKYFDIPLDRHHSALDDARACARLALAYRDHAGEIISILKSDEIEDKPSAQKEINLHDDLAGKTVVISGFFKNWPDRDALKQELINRGARVTSSLSSKTSYLIIGEMPGESKILKAQELCIPIVNGENI